MAINSPFVIFNNNLTFDSKNYVNFVLVNLYTKEYKTSFNF